MTEDQRRWAWGLGGTLVAALVFGNEGFRTMLIRYRDKAHLQKTIVQLHREHDQLQHELTLVQQDKSYNEFLVRKYLRYGKKGEVEYRFVTPTRHRD